MSRNVFQFKAPCFDLSTAPQVFTSALPGVGVGLQEGDLISLLLRRLVCHGRVGPTPSGTLQAHCLALSGLRIVLIWEKSYLWPTNKAQYLEMLIDIIQERVYLTDSQITRFLNVVDKLLCLLSQLAKMWQQILGHMASLQRLVRRGRARMHSLQ